MRVLWGMSSIELCDITQENYARLFTKENFCTGDIGWPVGLLE